MDTPGNVIADPPVVTAKVTANPSDVIDLSESPVTVDLPVARPTEPAGASVYNASKTEDKFMSIDFEGGFVV